MQLASVNLRISKRNLFRTILLFLFVSSYVSSVHSQGVIPTKGKDFWVGFPLIVPVGSNSERCEVFITSEINTTGTVSVPRLGWTQNFIVTANQTTTISLPVGIVQHTTSEVIENRGVNITSIDTISVFAISFQDYSADAAVVYPKQSLGIEYRTCNYQGLPMAGFPDLSSELLIVSTEDGTQVKITPACSTLGGHAAGIPFTVNLDAGQSYQVLASAYNLDLTGTVIEATDTSGSCRPFAVFSGSTCVNIPSGCAACDVLYEQAIPVPNWGKTYFAVPFSFATKYTIRVLADKNNTSYSINGGPATILNAGQFTEINNITGTQCITANQPLCVAQYMQGVTCAAAGDPSMMYLNAQEQKIDQVTFSTVTSTVITQHNVNVIINSSHINQLKLDGVNVPASSFTPLTSCSNISYAQLSLTQGSHTLKADSGFTAYAYGTGSAESYAYSVGSFSKLKPIQVDSFLCTSDTIQLGTSTTLFGSWWSTNTLPDDTIATGPILTLTSPIVPDIYIQHGDEYLSGCPTSFYFEVEVPIPPTLSVSSSALTACQNQLVQLTSTTLPASSSYNYSWTPITGLSDPNSANPVVTASVSMWYYLTVSSPNGCAPSVYDSIFINVLSLPLPVANGGANQSICFGSTTTLTATGGASYLWSPGGATTGTISISPQATSNYIVFVTDTNGCGNSDTVSVIVYPALNANAGQDQSICIGAAATLNASGGTFYQWSNGGSTTGSIIVTPNSTTNYILLVSDSIGCTDNDTVAVVVNSLPNANAGPDQITCNASPITLSASGGTTYLWSPGNQSASSIQISPASSTNYIVKVTDANGCENFDSVYVTVHPFITGSTSSRTVCQGEPFTLLASTGVSYLWDTGGSTDSTITVSLQTSTDIAVQVTTDLGCLIIDTFHVNVNPLPFAYAGPDVAICRELNATLTASGGVSYLWLANLSQGSSLVVSPDSSQDFVVQVTDGNGCIKNDSVFVTVYQLPLANAGIDAYICPGTSAILTASGGQTYQWNPGASTSSSISVSPSIQTNYIVDVVSVDGCMNSDTVTVFINQKPIVLFSAPSQACANYPQTFINYSSIVNGSIILNHWDFGDGINSNDVNGTHTYINPGIYDVRLIATAANGCIDSTNYMFTVNNLPQVDFETQSRCALQPGSYNDLSSVVPGVVSKWFWEFGDGGYDFTQNPFHAYKHPGYYDITLTVTSDSGCVASTKKLDEVAVFPLPEAGFVSHPEEISILEPSVQFFNSSTGGLVYHWDFGDGKGTSDLRNPYYSYGDTGTFSVQLILMNPFNCYDTTYGKIYIEPYFTVYFPNAFSPNGDNVNDYFRPYGEGINQLELQIFNRWGTEIFNSSGLSVSWDGLNKKGNLASHEGVYVYLAKVTDYKGLQHEFKGSVTLIR